MSKMTMPTIDVVRFEESDVIVASAAASRYYPMTLTGFGDGETGNEIVGYNGHEYKNNDSLKYAVGEGFDDNTGFDYGAGRVTWMDMRSMDYGNNPTIDTRVDGTYEWDSTRNLFNHQ